MAKNPISELILDQLAQGKSFRDLKNGLNISKKELIEAALYGVSELREEYFSILGQKKKKPPL